VHREWRSSGSLEGRSAYDRDAVDGSVESPTPHSAHAPTVSDRQIISVLLHDRWLGSAVVRASDL